MAAILESAMNLQIPHAEMTMHVFIAIERAQ
jgi:hypothetical protein